LTFEELNISKPLLRALNDLGLSSPTPIQEKAYPIIMSGEDVVTISQTGTGKTFSYLLPLLRQLTYSEQRQPRILVVVPTRELVVQVLGEIKKLTTYMTVRSGGVYGGTNINTQKQLVHNGLDILVATPGRLMDLYLSRVLQFNNIQKVVIDEVDELFNLGFRTQLVNLMDTLPKKRQNLMFSATLNEDVEKLIHDHFNKPRYIELITRGTPIEKIAQTAYHVPNFYTKVDLLSWMLNTKDELKKVLVFVKSKKMADDLYKELHEEFGSDIGIIHSNKTQPQRFAALQKFDNSVSRVLIATDIIARGLDISEVTHVINFDTPMDPSDYIHRIGRTGRADKPGAAIIFVTEKEQAYLNKIESLMKLSIPLADLPEEVEIAEKLTAEEKPAPREKKKSKKKEPERGPAFHEKKAKNRKEQLGGKRKQESLRRKKEWSMKKRKG
jgi:ATP-dependent RNA helicase RhlE